jgi:hypothetical protein
MNYHTTQRCSRGRRKLGTLPRIPLGDGARSAVQRRVQLGYRRWDIARLMKEFDLKKQKDKDRA